MPFCVMDCATMPWKMRPKPMGSDTYGAVRPKPRAQETARRSSFILFMSLSSGGIRSGMKAMCTGTTFCERQAMNARPKQKTSGLPPILAPIQRTSICMRPVCAIATAKVPRRM